MVTHIYTNKTKGPAQQQHPPPHPQGLWRFCLFNNRTSRYRQPRPRLTWSLQLETEPVTLELSSEKPF